MILGQFLNSKFPDMKCKKSELMQELEIAQEEAPEK
jgi:hypothetical protein